MVTRLLQHYWTADDAAAARQAQIEDWIVDLLPFGLEVVREALAEWRHRPGRIRPTPGDIRAICISLGEAAREHRVRVADQRATWPSWLYEIWGPASTGMIARQDAQRARDASLRRSEDWRREEAAAGHPVGAGLSIASALGVTAKEWLSSPAQMEAGRRALGLAEPEPTVPEPTVPEPTVPEPTVPEPTVPEG